MDIVCAKIDAHRDDMESKRYNECLNQTEEV